jgi:hypothetical protein
MPTLQFLITQLSFLDNDRVHRLPVQIPLQKAAMTKSKADMWELSGFNAGETRPEIETSKDPSVSGANLNWSVHRTRRLLPMATKTHPVYTKSQCKALLI